MPDASFHPSPTRGAPRPRRLAAGLLALPLYLAAEAAFAGCNPPVIGFEEGGVEPFPEIGTAHIVVQYHDQCGAEKGTWVYYRHENAGWTYFKYDGPDSKGWRTARKTGLASGQRYCFLVGTRGNDDVLRWSEQACARTVSLESPSLTILEDHVTAHSVELRWYDNNAEETGTYLDFRRDGSSSWSRLYSTGRRSTLVIHTHQGLEPESRYCYRVTTYRDYPGGRISKSDQACADTRAIVSGEDRHVVDLVEAGPVGEDGTLGFHLIPSVTRTYRFEAHSQDPHRCAAVALADPQGELIGYAQCGPLEVRLEKDSGIHRVYMVQAPLDDPTRVPAATDYRCDLSIDGSPVEVDGYCGWQAVHLSGLLQGERLDLVHLAPQRQLPAPESGLLAGRGPTLAMVLLPHQDGDSGFPIADEGGGIAHGARLDVPADYAGATVLVGIAGEADYAQPLRLVRNRADYANWDGDGDGLDYRVEAELGTCDHPYDDGGAIACQDLADLRDSDGDGISDAWEALGREAPGGYFLTDLPLPFWGASPRHKDLFMEVDFMRKSEEDNNSARDEGMPAAVARQMVAAYGFANVQDADRRARNAADLENPDGEAGIRLHLDTGTPPADPEDFVRFGDWGGHDAVDAVYEDGDWRGQTADEAWRDHLAPERIGAFKYALAYASGGGSDGWGFTAMFNHSDAYIAAHETGHTLGLGHAGPGCAAGVCRNPEPADVNCKPNYPSLMNYAYQGLDVGSEVGFSDNHAFSVPFDNAAMVERGALPHYGIGDLTSPDARDIMAVLEDQFRVWVDEATGDVDWNRDGRLAAAGETVRAYANDKPGGSGCELTRYNRMVIQRTYTVPGTSIYAETFTRTRRTPALARFRGGLYLFSVAVGDGVPTAPAAGEVEYAFTDSDFDCPIAGYDCGAWNVKRVRTGLTAAEGVDARRVEFPGGSELVVAGVHSDGRIRVLYQSTDGTWSAVQTLDQSDVDGQYVPAHGEPALIRHTADSLLYHAMLVFKGPEERLYAKVLRRQGGGWFWGPVFPVRLRAPDGSERHLKAGPLGAPTGLYTYRHDLRPRDISAGTAKALHLYVVDETGDLLLARYEGGYFAQEGRLSLGEVAGRLGAAWVPADPDQPYAGDLRIFYAKVLRDAEGEVREDSHELRYLRGRMEPRSGVYRGIDNGTTQVFDRWGYLDNTWVEGYGTAALYEPGVDRNLRVAFAHYGPGSKEARVELRPKADGVFDFDYRNYNDWLTLKYAPCLQVANPGGEAANQGLDPIQCRPMPEEDETYP